MLAFGLAVNLATGLAFGLAPAEHGSFVDLDQALKGARTSSGNRSQQRALMALVAGELALAFMLVLGVALLTNSYVRILNVNPGYDWRNVVTLSMLPDSVHYSSDESRVSYFDTVVERMRTIPGVETVGYASTLPLSHPDARRLHIYENPAASDAEAPNLDTYFVSADYLAAMRIPLLHGRGFSERDRRGSAPVAMVSESCVRTQFGGDEPIGKHVQVGIRDEQKPWMRIVGVVADVRQYGMDRKPDAAVYILFAQAEEVQEWASLVVRSKIGPERIEPAVRAALTAVDALQPLFHVQTMEAYVAKWLAQRTFTLALIGLFGGPGAGLGGFAGVHAYPRQSVVRRRADGPGHNWGRGHAGDRGGLRPGPARGQR
jgi:putative ABC transport system permease protein